MPRGTKHDQFKWTLERAQVEIGINNRTLTKRVRSLGLTPDITDEKGNKYFTTRQIMAACFGDYEGERLREIRAKADGLELDNARKRGELVEVAEFVRAYHKTLIQIRQVVTNAKGLPEDERRDLLLDLERIHDQSILPTSADVPKPKKKAAKKKRTTTG